MRPHGVRGKITDDNDTAPIIKEAGITRPFVSHNNDNYLYYLNG